ncbi:hypothetical protein [Paenibacillus segetis]|uniref:Copper amine oxidase N-terminal domain-containing protein n=1 Tax=Paenibacillus segetis TaxID=1325360 RepID=A0ABQ1Y9H5_9BACL|nr:hypothetical protein [Paenibacillus segetis]GGH17465.1 hypothetical protein GCM10008013_12820 [Paenibacillus segetis]
MKDKLKGLMLGIIIGSLLTGTSVMAANGTNITVIFKKMVVYFDGIKKSSIETIVYKNTTYIPINSVGKLIGKETSIVKENIYIGKKPKIELTEEQAMNILYSKIKKDADKYKLHFMFDGSDEKKYVIRVYEDFEDHIATYGWFYVNKSSGKITKMDISTGEEVDL